MAAIKLSRVDESSEVTVTSTLFGEIPPNELNSNIKEELIPSDSSIQSPSAG